MKKTIGSTLLALGVIFALPSVSIPEPLVQSAFWGFEGSGFVLFALGVIGVGCSFYLILFGLRYLQPTAQELLTTDQRPPVVFLRSFLDDQLTVKSIGPRPTLLALIPRPTSESALSRMLGGFGPLVAIGKSGERLPRVRPGSTLVIRSGKSKSLLGWRKAG